MKLVELLEVPQLMDACVRNGLYEEACDIVAFANTLERRHLLGTRQQQQQDKDKGQSTTTTEAARPAPGHAVVIAGLVGDLRALQRQLRERLLQQLRLPIQLPRCLQVGQGSTKPGQAKAGQSLFHLPPLGRAGAYSPSTSILPF